jgi:hypothetical protein
MARPSGVPLARGRVTRVPRNDALGDVLGRERGPCPGDSDRPSMVAL